jgi:hypothetical protein
VVVLCHQVLPVNNEHLVVAVKSELGTLTDSDKCKLWESSRTIMMPLCPPTMGMGASSGCTPVMEAVKHMAQTMSRVVTLNMHLGLYALALTSMDATMGTVELTGLEMMRMCTLGETQPIMLVRSWMMDGLVCRMG